MAYFYLKYFHIFLVILSVVIFNIRYWFAFRFPHYFMASYWRRFPPIIDTILLGSGISLAVWMSFNPASNAPWLAQKLCLLFFYIIFGIYALRSRPRGKTAISAYLLAMSCIALMVYLVHYKPVLW